MELSDVQKIHIIGIGGIGTSAAAKWCKAQGIQVTGSDMYASDMTTELMNMGISVSIGHDAAHVPDQCDLILYSGAVPETNPERAIAVERGIEQWVYARFLGEVAKTKKTIAVSGTNGKSTTTAMIGKILIDAGLDPTVILGTKSSDLAGGNMRVGNGEWFVVEACEHMAHMLEIQPDVAVITNIEEDHLDYYRDIDHIVETFQQWIDCEGKCARTVINRDDTHSQKLHARSLDRFGVDGRTVGEGVQTFEVAGVDVTLKIPGAFNAQNAAAALTAARLIGVEDDVALQALADFSGTWRRFEHLGTWHHADVYSDYAHHPSAIRGTIAAFKEFFPTRRLVVVFEPHQHSRTHELFDDFVESFDGVDVLVLSEIYQVEGRTEAKHESSKDLAHAVQERGKDAVMYAKDQQEARKHLETVVQDGDIVVIMGAGPIDNLARELVK